MSERHCRPVDLALFRRTVVDLEPFLLEQDVTCVGGGNTANMLAIWRVHGLDQLLRQAWESGIVLAGISAGAICWCEASVTDSFGLQLPGDARRTGLPTGQRLPALQLRRATPAGLKLEGMAVREHPLTARLLG